MEEIVLNIIIHAGNAKAKLYEALQASKENDFDNSNQSINEEVVLTDENNNINEDKTTQEENVEDNKVQEDNKNNE